ncbi:unnamed protein product [Auanema sp. JU1783]|nr:unnamed protein product [Auanema sp. JU1783]
MLCLDLRITAFFLCVHIVSSISIDNDIIGEPDIECLEDEIRIWVKTRKIFAGRIYAKGKADVDECNKDDFVSERTKKPHFDLKFGVCGMKSLRSVDPRGMYYGITVVVSFHPLFITKVDQAFHVKCFFEEANRGLTAELGVSMIPTTEVEARHGIPGCSYTIHRSSIEDLDAGNPAGPPIQFARVGDRVLHQWHCNDKMFGVLVNNCYVTDGFGKKADVIDSNGCAIDPILITGIRYSSDLQRAYAESSVFKFADKPGVWFFCQIQMCMKKSGMCQGITPPSCSSTAAPLIEGENSEFSSLPSSRNSLGENTDYFDKPTQGRIPKTSKGPQSTSNNEYSDYTEEKDLKLHSPDSTSYNSVTPAVDYELQTEAVTVFGPAFSDSSPTSILPHTSESVSQTFETEDDLTTNEFSTTAIPKSGSSKSSGSDYNDYDEITIPPNLSDLLDNLPDDLSADSLQKMFRDSVDDRKALLDGFEMLKRQMKKKPTRRTRPMRDLRPGDLRSGDKIDQIVVDWTSKRRRDSPIIDDDIHHRVTNQRHDVLGTEKPMISGQLMIFDLDETPPPDLFPREAQKDSNDSTSICAVSRNGLVAIAGGLGSVCAALFIITLTLYIKLSRKSGK